MRGMLQWQHLKILRCFNVEDKAQFVEDSKRLSAMPVINAYYAVDSFFFLRYKVCVVYRLVSAPLLLKKCALSLKKSCQASCVKSLVVAFGGTRNSVCRLLSKNEVTAIMKILSVR